MTCLRGDRPCSVLVDGSHESRKVASFLKSCVGFGQCRCGGRGSPGYSVVVVRVGGGVVDEEAARMNLNLKTCIIVSK